MPENDLTLLVEAAREAGEIAKRHWQQKPRSWNKPGHQGPVSEADLEIDAALRSHLMAARPGYGWLSEESEDDPARLNADRVFIVDPLDGTRAFLNNDRSFAHSLAVAENGVVTAAAVLLPIPDKLYTATRGGGAALNGAALQVSQQPVCEGASLLAAAPVMDSRNWIGTPPKVDRHLRPSLAYRLCLIAEGRFDALVTIRNSWEWDLAAGTLIIQEAGGTVTDRLDDALSFNALRPQAQGVIAANPTLHKEFAARLA
ncbi:inositol monophosphatase family protein [Actibacterium ureilyticum]|uniref:inositol monophosphatase family protein n=1 Tax=Actibacterium ureilyticum TaxID=1590614 RepID=UPI000BAACADD|nr:3'(2'),5'-bisphosphate nucleotidase CysQ [Actibacterium ureilyticum]